jgi:hypothetical protein
VLVTRRDRRGRRIGHNWWRELNCELLLDADLTWQREREAASSGYPAEERDFAEANPRPTLKAFLLANKSMNVEPSRQ